MAKRILKKNLQWVKRLKDGESAHVSIDCDSGWHSTCAVPGCRCQCHTKKNIEAK